MKKHITVFNPAITPWVLLRALFVRQGDAYCESWFRKHTGKKYILITSSCRNALWLAYKAASIEGDVITTPLICHSALESAIAAGLKIRFCDLANESFLMDANKVAHCISPQTRFVQATHQGGQMMDMLRIREIADAHNLLVIEDCAQAFSASFRGITAGSMGDVSCFTLTKNCYGIGGGILATDHKEVYLKAKALQDTWPRFQKKLLLYRMVRYILESYRSRSISEYLYHWMMHKRKSRRKPSVVFSSREFTRHRPAKIFGRIFRIQQPRFEKLHRKTSAHADYLTDALRQFGIHSITPMVQSSFPKFFISHPGIYAREIIPAMLQHGIEARHLENRYGSPFQKRLEELGLGASLEGLESCPNYSYLYDHIISLPMHHALKPGQIVFIAETLKKLLDAQDPD